LILHFEFLYNLPVVIDFLLHVFVLLLYIEDVFVPLHFIL
jgi:hypothetical protein